VLIAADPGLDGALAFFDPDCNALYVEDMPTVLAERKTKNPKRIIDEVGLLQLVRFFEGLGARHFVVEEVGGMPGQGGPHSFSFGYGAGLLRMAAHSVGLAVEPVRPQTWKGVMRVPTLPDGIRTRATEVFPAHAAMWDRGKRKPSSEYGLGRAEAALLAAYGERILARKKP